MDVTVSCADGEEGNIYEGLLEFEVKQIHLKNMPEIGFKINMNVGNPDRFAGPGAEELAGAPHQLRAKAMAMNV